MEKLLGYKPFHFLLFLVLGISFQFYTDCWNFGIVTSLCIFLFLVLICYSLRKSSFFGLLIGSVFFFIGIFILHNGDATKDENYFGNHTANNAAVVLKINSILKSGNYHQKYIAEVIQINLERLIKMLNPTLVIADGSNYKSYVSLWRASCLELQTPFWSTGKKGAYILNK